MPTISGEVKRHFRDLGWTVRPPRRVQELQARISSVSADSRSRPGAVPQPAEVAARLGVDVSEVIEALTCNGVQPDVVGRSLSVSQDPRPRSVTCSLGPRRLRPRRERDRAQGGTRLRCRSRDLLILQRGSSRTSRSKRSARRSASARCRSPGCRPGSSGSPPRPDRADGGSLTRTLRDACCAVAEDRGFEPLRAINPTRFPSERHRPLGESSAGEATCADWPREIAS